MRYNFPIVYGPKTVFYNLPNGTDRELLVSNCISLGILDMAVRGGHSLTQDIFRYVQSQRVWFFSWVGHQ